MPKISELTSHTPPKLVLYGLPGSGKSAFGMSAGPYTQLLDLDNGYKTALNLADKWRDNRLATDIIQLYEDNPRIASAFSRAKTKAYEISDLCRQGRYPFKILVVDSFSSLGEFALRYVMQNSGGIDKPRAIQHWGAAISELEGFLLILRSLPIVVVLVAHSQRDLVDTRPIIEIGVYGKALPGNVPKYFDEVLFSYVRPEAGGKRSFLLKTIADDIITARSRACLPDAYPQDNGLEKLLLDIGYKL